MHRLLVNKYYVDEAYQWAIDRVFLGLGRLVAVFDRVIVNDTGVDGPALSVWLSAMRVRYIQSGLIVHVRHGHGPGSSGSGPAMGGWPRELGILYRHRVIQTVIPRRRETISS